MGKHEVEHVVRKRQSLAVRDLEPGAQSLLFEIGTGELYCRGRQVHTGDVRAAFCETGQVDGGAAAHFENAFPPAAVERHELEQVMELLEVILIEVIEESARSNRVAGDFKIVDVTVPIRADLLDRRHAGNYMRISLLASIVLAV